MNEWSSRADWVTAPVDFFLASLEAIQYLLQLFSIFGKFSIAANGMRTSRAVRAKPCSAKS